MRIIIDALAVIGALFCVAIAAVIVWGVCVTIVSHNRRRPEVRTRPTLASSPVGSDGHRADGAVDADEEPGFSSTGGKSARSYAFDPDWVVRPGAIFQEELQERGYAWWYAAQALNLTTFDIDRLIRGELAIEPDLAIAIARLFGGSPETWMKLEAMYREGLAAGKKDIG